MNNKLFVGGLSWGTTEQTLREFLEEKGATLNFKLEDSENAVKIIKDRDTGRSKGFGFVIFASEADATIVMENLNGVEFDGRFLKFDFAKEKEERGGGFRPRN